MIIIQVIELILILFLLPVCMGVVVAKRDSSLIFLWIQGILIEWGLFLTASLPCIIKGYTLTRTLEIWGILIGVCTFIGAIMLFASRKAGNSMLMKTSFDKLSKSELIYLALFIGIVLFQIYKAIFYVYEDGDDAYYISVAVSAAASDKMYMHEAYTGFGTTPNYRYALAPFPIWLSALSRISGIEVPIIAHTIIPPVMIVLTYCIYTEISKELFASNREKRYLFLMLVSIFIMFENVSTSTQGSFLLARSRQGKEALANVVLPFMFLMILKFLKSNMDGGIKEWLQLVSACMAASLTSVLGNMLAPLMVLFLVILAIIKKKSIKKILLLGSSIIPCGLMFLLYLKM